MDTAIDEPLSALDADLPDPSKVNKALASLQASLADPSASSSGGLGVGTVSGITVTDANGHGHPPADIDDLLP